MDNELILSRVRKLRNWHEKIKRIDDERAYETWINYVPDEPLREHFESIAENDESFFEVERLYHRLVRQYGED